MRIAVLGAGSWGTTLAILLADKSHHVVLWSYRVKDAETTILTRENPASLPGIYVPPSISVTSDLREAVNGAEMVVCAVPSQYLRSAMVQLRDRPWDSIVVVNVAKGIENGT